MDYHNKLQQYVKSENLIGVDIGSTTVKVTLVQNGRIVSESYERHLSQARAKAAELISNLKEFLADDSNVKITISGSAGMGFASACGFPFVQEVFASGEALEKLENGVDVAVELGGEDAKIMFFDPSGIDEKMNGSCAGGTGAFIDQMANLLGTDTAGLDKMSLEAGRVYPIASRCGVFAKTDIQPLINEGANKSDIALSVFYAVANQTVAGLSQGRKIGGRVAFLGGPLYYCRGLQKAFVDILKLKDENALFPPYSREIVAIGAALLADSSDKEFKFGELCRLAKDSVGKIGRLKSMPPLFKDEDEYKAFLKRHEKSSVKYQSLSSYSGGAYLGVDCGSTTTKLVLIGDEGQILYSYYNSNMGNPVAVVKNCLREIYNQKNENTVIRSATSTGYGEELVKNAFSFDCGIVETIAHFKAAKYFEPDVDFILDIGGQDIKCFKIRNNAIDSIMLNEACSSGCGSFIETFAKTMGYNVKDFARLGLFARHPVDLGSRCTVFMNSSVKEAQRDGATVGDISAGLSMSVVKNALYKVIRVNRASGIGSHVVVQGGTFYNDAILRSFEREIGAEVIRPNIAGLMGAYGCALYSREHAGELSSTLSEEELENFEYSSKSAVCKGCTNHCNLVINTFSGGRRFISGNKCDRMIRGKKGEDLPDLYEEKFNYLTSLKSEKSDRKIGLPMALGMYELLPFWHSLFTSLGFEVVLSGTTNKATYLRGQHTIPSDTICYPAKLMHGHIETLINKGVDTIFYPSLTYNVKEKETDNHFNCPVVAYYGEVIDKNIDEIKDVDFYYPYLNINSEKELTKELYNTFREKYGFKKAEIKSAIAGAKKSYFKFRDFVRQKTLSALDFAKRNAKKVLIFAGRPYHIDPEINHSINKLATKLGFVVVSEDGVAQLEDSPDVAVLNQWTFHSRMYKAAKYATEHKNVNLVQLVSFGCGLDAITTDEIKDILESKGKLYTQIKIDEISNLGAVRIRLRSLLGALEERQ